MYFLFTSIPYVGHLNPLLRQAAELKRRGHRVAFAGAAEVSRHVALDAPDVPFVDLGTLGPVADELRKNNEAASRDPNFVRGSMRITRGLNAAWLMMFDGLAKAISKDRPDFMVVDLFSSAGLSAAEAASVPAAVNNPDLLAALPVTMFPPADHLPFLFSGRSRHAVPWHQKFTGPLTRRVAALLASLVVERDLNALRRARGLPPTTAHRLLAGRLILVNGVFGLEYERPLPPGFEMVGSMLPETIPPLPDDLASWLNGGPPAVYMNLGTLAVAPGDQIDRMADAFRNAPFRSLWILPDMQAERLAKTPPANVRILNWGPPPLSVLSHPNVKAFVTHCGINSAHEAMQAGTPIVGIPMFADQRDMAVRVADAGAGIWLDKMRFTAADLRAAIERVLRDDSFARNTQPVRSAMERAGGVRRAADLITRAAAEAARRPRA